jgi:hypothetical protein
VLADTRLRLRETLRRNGEGSLWRPRWWPTDLAPLFWPLLLALALALLVGLGLGLARLKPVPAPGPVPAAQRDATVSSEPAPDAVAVPPREATPAPTPEPAPEPSPEPDAMADAELEPTLAPELEPAIAPEPPPPDPLVLLLQRPGADGLIRAADGQVEASTLVLQLAPAFPALAPQEQQRRAELWQQWGRDLGYDHLELRDSRAGLLGRDALVGNGMILFSSDSRA